MIVNSYFCLISTVIVTVPPTMSYKGILLCFVFNNCYYDKPADIGEKRMFRTGLS